MHQVIIPIMEGIVFVKFICNLDGSLKSIDHWEEIIDLAFAMVTQPSTSPWIVFNTVYMYQSWEKFCYLITSTICHNTRLLITLRRAFVVCVRTQEPIVYCIVRNFWGIKFSEILLKNSHLWKYNCEFVVSL